MLDQIIKTFVIFDIGLTAGKAQLYLLIIHNLSERKKKKKEINEEKKILILC